MTWFICGRCRSCLKPFRDAEDKEGICRNCGFDMIAWLESDDCQQEILLEEAKRKNEWQFGPA